MRNLPELRVELSPAIAAPGQWSIKVVDRYTGNTLAATTVTSLLEQADLEELRLPRWNPNVERLRTIGSRIWNTVMSGPIGHAFDKLAAQRGVNPWRLVFVLRSSDSAAVRISDLPIEGMFRAQQQAFVALRMPVSRTLHVRPDRDPQSIALPLRIAVAVATPTDRTEAKAEAEVAAIEKALEDELAANRVQLHVVPNATVDKLAAAMRDHQPHVLHFIGHGGFDIVAADTTPRPYVCFEDSNHETKYVYPEGMIGLAAEGGSTRLVVLTACSTAAASNSTETGEALDGMAQIMAHDGRFSATVAMQFALEPWAAEAFSGEFYKHLAAMDDLDHAVKKARESVARIKGESERAWLNPVVYWRCTSGRVFTFAARESTRLTGIEALARAVRKSILEMWAAPRRDMFRDAFAPMLSEQLTRLHAHGEQRSIEVRDCLRAVGGMQPPGQPLVVPILLRTGVDATVNSVVVSVAHPGLALRVERGADAAVDPALNVADDTTRITLAQPGGIAKWPAGEREIARLVVTSDVSALTELRLHGAALVGDGQPILCNTVSGWACFL